MRHALQLLLSVFDTLGDVAGEFLEQICESVLLRAGLARGSLVLCVGGDAAVWVQTLDGSLGLVENTTTLFDQGPDFPDKRLLVTLIFGGALCCIDFLVWVSGADNNKMIALNTKLTSVIILQMGRMLSKH
jgi:hypothetical protein